MEEINIEGVMKHRRKLNGMYNGFPKNCCWTASDSIEKIFGYEACFGLFMDDENEGNNHHWNETKTKILDICAGQFGNFPDIYIIDKDSPESERYVEGVYVMC